MEQATENEFFAWFYANADFDPADEDVRNYLKERFIDEMGKSLPDGYGLGE